MHGNVLPGGHLHGFGVWGLQQWPWRSVQCELLGYQCPCTCICVHLHVCSWQFHVVVLYIRSGFNISSMAVADNTMLAIYTGHQEPLPLPQLYLVTYRSGSRCLPPTTCCLKRVPLWRPWAGRWSAGGQAKAAWRFWSAAWRMHGGVCGLHLVSWCMVVCDACVWCVWCFRWVGICMVECVVCVWQDIC